jgi:hypothetical protein
VTTLEDVRIKLRPYENNILEDGEPRYLFRGQREQHSTITSTFDRLPLNAGRGQAQTVFRRGHQLARGLRGYSVSPVDGVAVLQHYGWPTPLIDFSGVLEVAVFFALFRAKLGAEAVIYVLDRTKLPDNVVFVDHDFLTNELSDGGTRHRWLRQDGFAFTSQNWQVPDVGPKFDLLSDPFKPCLVSHPFTVRRDDASTLPDVLDQTADPLPAHLQNLLRLLCDHQFGANLHPDLRQIIDEIPVYPQTQRA